jgi:dTDP-glucose 4,6-dehydratase
LLFAHDKLDLRVSVVVLSRDPARFREKAPHLAGHSAVRLLGGNVIGFDFPDGRYPFVIHAATEPSFAADSDRPLGAFNADVEGTRRVLEFARRHGVRRLLFTSSGAVYGRQPPDMTHISEDYVGAPSTIDVGAAYGQAKRVSEFMCTMYGRTYGFDAVIARLFAFVGPLLPLDANYAVGNFIRDALGGGPVQIAGDGTPYRSYLYAADLAIWLWTMLFRGKAAYPYNVGSQRDITIANLARTVVQVSGSEVSIEVAKKPVPGAASLRYVPCVDRIQTELGLQPTILLEEGVRRTFEWCRTCQ